MTREISTTDSSLAVDTDWLIATFEPGESPANDNPVSQSIADVIQAGISEREFEILAESRSTTTSGQTSLELPSDYTDYKNYEIVVGDDQNTIAVLRGTTSWLSVQQDGDNVRFGFIDKDEAGSRQWITWTLATRTFAFGTQGGTTNAPRFKSARLYDSVATSSSSAGAGLNESEVDSRVDVGVSAHDVAADAHTDIRNSLATQIADINRRFEDFEDFQSVTVSTADSFQATLNSQLASDKALILVIDADISGIRSGERFTYSAGQVAYVPPTSDVLETLFVLPAGGEIADNSITPAKAQADTSARQKSWRQRFGSAHIGAGTTLPEASASNDGDVRIFTQDVASGLVWTDISDPSTRITDANAGDVALYLGRAGWTRVGNILSSRDTSGGLTQSQVDARVQAGVEDWAETGNTDTIPPEKIHADIARDSAVDAVETTADTALSRTQRIRPINQWVRAGGAQTLLVEWKPVGAVANGAALAVSINGANISGVTASEGLAASDTQGTIVRISVNAANAGTIDRTANAIAGHVEIQITHGGVVDTCWMGVRKSTDWRPITTPASPYTVSEHDSEFLIEVDQSQTNPRNVPIIKAQLTPGTAKNITFAQNRVDNQGTTQSTDVSVTLSANERQLAVSITGNGSSSWSVVGVYAR